MNQHYTPQPEIVALMRAFDIGWRELAWRADVDLSSVESALDSRWLSRCPIITLLKVRTSLETLLQERGWRGDRQRLWGDLDTVLTELEAEERRCR